MNNIELRNVLDEHLQWLNDSATGHRANLCDANLCDANLRDDPEVFNFQFSIDGLRAKDEAHALKIASDTLAEYKALIEVVW